MKHTLNTLIFGQTGQVLVKSPLGKTPNYNNIKVALELAANGYKITNLDTFMLLSDAGTRKFVKALEKSTNELTKDSFFLRKSFATTTSIEAYTAEDWQAIFCQYAIDYGKSTDPAHSTFLDNYTSAVREELPVLLANSEAKEISVLVNLSSYLASIINNPTPLRAQQIEILKASPVVDLEAAIAIARPTIRATKALANNIVVAAGGKPSFRSVDELQRFILANCQQGSNGIDYDGQILSTMLKTFRFHIPTKYKKLILSWLDSRSNSNTVESMLSNEDWWKRCIKHCHWTSKAKQLKRYPKLYTQLLPLLYSDDRSWTYNSRYAAATEAGDYAKAIELAAAERPGTILRSLVMFCKYKTGTALPVKYGTKVPKKAIDVILGSSRVRQATTDASNFFETKLTSFLATKTPSIKLCWQAIEELLRSEHKKPIYSRTVQDKVVGYSTPIPALDKDLTVSVIQTIGNYILASKASANASMGKVYLDPELERMPVQYSGSSDDSIALSGSYLPSGSRISLPKTGYIRFGVCGKDAGHGSCDIDLSSVFGTRKVVSFNSPTYGKIATSSGDITSCGTGKYSAEFIDVNIAEAIKAGEKGFYNILNMVSGKTLDKYNTHTFINILKPSERVVGGRNVSIDLSKQTHAIKVTSATKKHVGVYVDLQESTAMVVNKPFDSTGIVAGASIDQVAKIIGATKPELSLLDVLSRSFEPSQLVTSADKADTIIGMDSTSTINATTELEQINKVIF